MYWSSLPSPPPLLLRLLSRTYCLCSFKLLAPHAVSSFSPQVNAGPLALANAFLSDESVATLPKHQTKALQKVFRSVHVVYIVTAFALPDYYLTLGHLRKEHFRWVQARDRSHVTVHATFSLLICHSFLVAFTPRFAFCSQLQRSDALLWRRNPAERPACHGRNDNVSRRPQAEVPHSG